jgi:pimeloyl-ACP methyl ester carboxylesterase
MSIRKHGINGFEIEYYESGDRDQQTIVFAHGLGSNLRQWKAQVSYFEKNYHVIAFSLQGHGESSKSKQKDVYSIPAYVDVALQLLDELRVKDCIWIGNSMGGVIGYGVLGKRPALIRHLITNGTTPEIKMSHSLLKIVGAMDRLLIKFMGFQGYLRFAAKNSTKYIEAQELIFKLFEKTTPDTIITSHQILGDYSYLALIEKTETPITIIKCPRDKDINSYLVRQNNFLSQINHVEMVEFPETGHLCNMEKPDEYNRMIVDIIT